MALSWLIIIMAKLLSREAVGDTHGDPGFRAA